MLSQERRTQLDGIVQQMAQKNAPVQDVQMIVSDFKNKYDTPDTQQPRSQQQDQQQSQGIFSKIKDWIQGTGQAASGIGEGFLKGATKSVLDTGYNVGKLGAEGVSKVGEAVGVLPKGLASEISQTQTPYVLKAQGTSENIGKVVGDVAQFFIPGKAETQAITSLDKLVDTAKLAEKFGPEAGKVMENILKVISHGVVTGASTAGVTAAQTGNLEETKGAGIAGFLAGAGGKILQNVAPSFAKAMAKMNLKMSPQQETKLATQGEKAAKFISENKIWGTPESQFNKIDKATSEFEKTLLSNVKGDTKFSTDTILKNLDSIPEQFKGDKAVYAKVKNDVEAAKEVLKETQGGEITLQEILDSKRSYGKDAFDKAGNKMIKESKFAIQDAYYKALEEHFPVSLESGSQNVQLPKNMQQYFGGKAEVPVRDFNAKYGEAINARKFMDIARNKNDVGLMGRLLSAFVGGTAASALGPLGEVGGAFLGAEAASKGGTLIRSGVARAVQGGETTIPAIVRAGLGMSNASNQDNQ